MLKLIVQHSPKLLVFLCGLHLRLHKPQWQHVLRLADALVVSEARHKTIASLSRLIVEAPDPSHGADTLRMSPWTAEDLRAPLRQFIVADVVAYAHQSNHWTLYVSLDDSWDEKDQGTRHLEAVEYHHDHTKSQGTKKPYYTNAAVHVEVRLALGTRSYAYDWRLYLREKTVRRLNRERGPKQRLRFRKKTTLAQEMLAELPRLLPSGFQVYVLFDSWYAANRLRKFCRRQRWQVVCAIKSNRKLDDQKRSQWPQALRHQRYQRVQLTATDGRQRSYLVRPRQGRLTHLSFDVCVLISKRHARDTHPKYFLCTDLALSAQQILSIYQRRWSIEVDNFYVKQHLGLADFRVQSYEATEKWFAVVFLAFVFLPWRLNHADSKEPMHSLADVVRQHRYEHARTLLETACQEAAQVCDYFSVLKRFLCLPTSDSKKRQSPDPKTGDIEQLARDIVQGLPTYWELSPSGTGLRGFAFGRKPGGRCRSGDFEMYASGRYLCITGHHLAGTATTVEAIQEAIAAVYTQIFPPKDTDAPAAHTNGMHLEYADHIILDAARRAKNGADFIALFDEGNRQRHLHDDGSPDYSRSDAALCRLLAFYTKHEEQLDRLFRVSAFNRPKWEGRADYRASTIDLAIQSTPDQWSGPAISRNGQPHGDAEDECNAPSVFDETERHQGDVTLENVIETFRDWLDLPDAGFIEVLLATYAANQIPGDPVWLLAVGPSSGGKTEPLQAMLGLPHTKLASTLTESALLSGTPKRDKDKSSTGGLLREIGEFGYLILKDFTSVLAMQDKIRMTTVAALREIYDQSWARPLGIDGGRVLYWKGKVAIMAGCTDIIDSHHTLMTAMGSRFLMYRIPTIDAYAQAAKAYDMNVREAEMRQKLRRVITGFFSGRDFSTIRPITSEGIRERLIQLSILAVVARSPIERDRHTREITLIPDPEAPARVTKALGKLYAALLAVGVSDMRAWALVRKIALDSMPKLRYALIKALAEKRAQRATELAIAIHHPTQTTKRALEDLVGLKLVEREKIPGIRADLWSLTDETTIRLRQLPEIIENEDINEL